jgi:hypothetical protein
MDVLVAECHDPAPIDVSVPDEADGFAGTLRRVPRRTLEQNPYR